ncbi:hypothetical protein NBT05_13345 [Aquimarina sp. ERC-38]|uniref:hypothetical protein n=1 Tax=Aquimarina sp. ERC-38 TaxID=2949996 RepID=UPI002247DCB3|nr:hypothetical protein [Aquimarina sp. ERC-38]UZO79929.1 hypothetical protein NBT05_13345 [Aquimarina sp. ERC-38]
MLKISCPIPPSDKTDDLSITIKRYTNIEEIPESHWKEVSKYASVFLDLPYLKALQKSGSNTLSFNFYLGYDNNKVIGIAFTQNIVVDRKLLEETTLPCEIGDGLKKIVSQKLETRLLICGNIFATGSFGFQTIPNSWQQAFLNGLVKYLLDTENYQKDKKPSFILFKDFPNRENSGIKWENFKLKPITIDQVMIMQIPEAWKIFEDYQNALRTKFRSRLKKTFEKSSEIKLVDFDTAAIIKYQKEISTLYQNVLDKADYKLSSLSINSFIEFKRTLPESFMFTGYILEEHLVGFTTYFLNKNILETSHVGLDYRVNQAYQVYQRMLYEYIKAAIVNHKAQINFGRTAETIKSSVGAVPIPMQLYIRHINGISNTVLTPLTRLIKPNEFELRSPFKQV